MEKKIKESKPTVTRAEKRDAVKNLIREVLAKESKKSNDVIDEAAKLYAERFGGEDTENPNDVKGRVGSVLDVMKKEGDVQFAGGVYSLKAKEVVPVEKEKVEKAEEKGAEKAEEKPVKRARKTTKKETDESVKTKKTASKKKTEKAEPLPAAPIQPIAPVAPITPEIAPEPIPKDEEKDEETSAPKKRGRKPRAAEVKAEKVEEKEKKEEKAEMKTEEPKKEEKKETSPKGTVMDMSFLFGEIKPTSKPQAKAVGKAEKTTEKSLEKPVTERAEKAEEKKPEVKKVAPKKAETKKPTQSRGARSVKKALTPDEKLQEAFLNRLHRLGGEYFEYYSVYLLEKYSRKNGRRLESLKITGGDHDGGIDGEIELTDTLGFRETIYIQAKNWDPDKGDEKLWVVGETLLQQFIGACVCRQAKEGKQRCRGIFITTSRFTPEAQRMLNDTADHFVGYDGAELYETAKECEFGIVKKNGEWVLDEALLSGMKAFFNMP